MPSLPFAVVGVAKIPTFANHSLFGKCLGFSFAKVSCKSLHVCNDFCEAKKRCAMKIDYARVSTLEQNLDLQLRALKKSSCKRIFQEKVSSTGRKKTDFLMPLLPIATFRASLAPCRTSARLLRKSSPLSGGAARSC